MSAEELQYLKDKCPYLNETYLQYLSSFRFRPSEQVQASFSPTKDYTSEDVGDVHLIVEGSWVEIILYEIPLLALTSEAYFKFCDKDWRYSQQEENACSKGKTLLENGCVFTEFGSRRRRDFHTQDLVLQGLTRVAAEGQDHHWKGKLNGTSNVYFAMKYGIPPVGTVAHEFFMGIASITNDYENAGELALRYWIGCYGQGVLDIALTDTFGTPAFLRSFKQRVPTHTTAARGAAATLPSSGASSIESVSGSITTTTLPLEKSSNKDASEGVEEKSYAQVFAGVRQDSGDPLAFIKIMRDFYDGSGIKEKKAIVFSDSLNIELCLELQQAAEDANFFPIFGIGTFFTSK